MCLKEDTEMAKLIVKEWEDIDKKYSRRKKKMITTALSARLLSKLVFKTKKKADDKILMSAALIADLHVDGDTYRGRNNMVRQGIAGISCYKKFDAIIMAGDITNSAHISEYTNLKHYLDKYNKVERIIPEMGNHDSRATSIEPNYNEALKLYNDFCAYCGIEKGEKAYYSTDLKGFRVITLASEGIPNTDQAIISDEQIEWFEKELKAAAELKKPIFVISHQPPAGRNNAQGGGAIGESSERIDKILCENSSAEAPVIYISGHMHRMNGCDNPKEGLYFINMEAFTYSRGVGFTAEVYADHVVLEGCNFVTGESYDGYRFEIAY